MGAPAVQPKLEDLAPLTPGQLTQRYAAGMDHLDHRVMHLTDPQLDTAFLPTAGVGRWPARVLLGHLADAELAFVHRMRRVVAEDGPVFSVWDENAFLDRGLYGIVSDSPGWPHGPRGSSAATDASKHPIAAFVAVLHTLRKWTGPWLATLPDSDWQRRGMHPERGEQTLRRITEYATWHLEHHAWFLNRKVEVLATPSPR